MDIGRFLKHTYWFVFSLLILLLFTFVMSVMNPVDPVIALIGESATQEIYDATAKSLGLDKPVIIRFCYYVKGLLSGDIGVSFLTKKPVWQDLQRVLPLTLELATIALLFGIFIGIPLGVLCAFKKGRLDKIVRSFVFIGHSVPNFLIGYGVLMLALSMGQSGLHLGDMQTGLIRSLIRRDWNALAESWLILWPPAVLLAYIALAYITRMMRGFVLHEISAQYMITAKIKHLSFTRVFFVHMMPNIMPRLLPVLILSYTQLLEGSVITETVFSLNGIGSYLVRAVLAHDETAIMGTTLIVGVIVLSCNFLVDTFVDMSYPQTPSQRSKT
ncbi:MAG: ABC transporter permease [Alphaproteobacteria bacterium]|nr:ABC transporter permease [Alphaproteobacteria bacterium]